jgi:hypothetical protein
MVYTNAMRKAIKPKHATAKWVQGETPMARKRITLENMSLV